MDYKRLIRERFNSRRRKNARYSLRAFARDLGISVTTLSGFLNDKRHLSPRSIMQICSILKIDKEQTKKMLEDAKDHTSYNRTKRQNRKRFSGKQMKQAEYRLLEEWYHFPVLNLIQLGQVEVDSKKWPYKSLDITKIEFQNSVKLLSELGLIEASGQLYMRTSEYLTTMTDVTHQQVFDYNKKIMEHGLQVAGHLSPLYREMGSIFLHMAPGDLVELKKMLRAFQQKVHIKASKSKEKKTLYSFCTMIVPLTKDYS